MFKRVSPIALLPKKDSIKNTASKLVSLKSKLERVKNLLDQVLPGVELTWDIIQDSNKLLLRAHWDGADYDIAFPEPLAATLDKSDEYIVVGLQVRLGHKHMEKRAEEIRKK